MELNYVVKNFKAKNSQYAVHPSLPIWGDLEGGNLKLQKNPIINHWYIVSKVNVFQMRSVRDFFIQKSL